jgi:biopolymer transport protein ExbB
MEDLAAFTNDLHGYLMSAGAVKPRLGGAAPAKGAPQPRTATAPSEPVRTPTTAK